MTFLANQLFTFFKYRGNVHKNIKFVGVLLSIYVILNVMVYSLKKMNKDNKYFESTYRKNDLDKYSLWDDNLLSPREVEATEGKHPLLILE